MEHYLILSTLLFFIALLGIYYDLRVLASWLFILGLCLCVYLSLEGSYKHTQGLVALGELALNSFMYLWVCRLLVCAIACINLYYLVKHFFFLLNLSVAVSPYKYLYRLMADLFLVVALLILAIEILPFFLKFQSVIVFTSVIGLATPEGELSSVWPIEDLTISAMTGNSGNEVIPSKVYVGEKDKYMANATGAVWNFEHKSPDSKEVEVKLGGCVNIKKAFSACNFKIFGGYVPTPAAVKVVTTFVKVPDLLCVGIPDGVTIHQGHNPNTTK